MTDRRTLPVTLRQIRLDVRTAAARQCARYEVEEAERAELLAVALVPSSTVYWLHASALPILRSVAA